MTDRSPNATVNRGFPMPEMVRLPGGTFRTEADPSKKIEAKDYTVGTFWIGKYEVTFEQFDRFGEETGCYLKRYHGIDRPPGTGATLPPLPIGIPAWD